jgi:hypothetical protein
VFEITIEPWLLLFVSTATAYSTILMMVQCDRWSMFELLFWVNNFPFSQIDTTTNTKLQLTYSPDSNRSPTRLQISALPTRPCCQINLLSLQIIFLFLYLFFLSFCVSSCIDIWILTFFLCFFLCFQTLESFIIKVIQLHNWKTVQRIEIFEMVEPRKSLNRSTMLRFKQL